MALPRDDDGWRIPRGSRSRRIYALAKAGKSSSEIAAIIGGSVGALRVLLWKIRNPDDANAAEMRNRTRV